MRGQIRAGLRTDHAERRREAARPSPRPSPAMLTSLNNGSAGSCVAERGHPERVLGRQRRERREQTRIHFPGPQLPGIGRGVPEARVPEQLGARALAGGEIGPQGGLVCGCSAALGRAGLDSGAPEPKPAISAGAYWSACCLLTGGRSPPGWRRAGWPPRSRAGACEPDALRLQRGTHAGIARNHRVAAHLGCDPGRGPVLYARPGSHGGHGRTACGIGAACRRIAAGPRLRAGEALPAMTLGN